MTILEPGTRVKFFDPHKLTEYGGVVVSYGRFNGKPYELYKVLAHPLHPGVPGEVGESEMIIHGCRLETI